MPSKARLDSSSDDPKTTFRFPIMRNRKSSAGFTAWHGKPRLKSGGRQRGELRCAHASATRASDISEPIHRARLDATAVPRVRWSRHRLQPPRRRPTSADHRARAMPRVRRSRLDVAQPRRPSLRVPRRPVCVGMIAATFNRDNCPGFRASAGCRGPIGPKSPSPSRKTPESGHFLHGFPLISQGDAGDPPGDYVFRRRPVESALLART